MRRRRRRGVMAKRGGSLGHYPSDDSFCLSMVRVFSTAHVPSLVFVASVFSVAVDDSIDSREGLRRDCGWGPNISSLKVHFPVVDLVTGMFFFLQLLLGERRTKCTERIYD